MSTKDLMDRLERTGSGAKPAQPRAPEQQQQKAGDPKANETKRVGDGVVRRRTPLAAPEPPPPPARTVIRRPGPTREEPPARVQAPVAQQGAPRPQAAAATPQPSVAARPSNPSGLPPRGTPVPLPNRAPVAVEPQSAAPPTVVDAAVPASASVSASVSSGEPPVYEPAADAPSVAQHVAAEPSGSVDESGPAPRPEQMEAPAAEHVAAVQAPVEALPPAPPVRAEPTLERAVIIDRPGGFGRLPSMAATGARAAPARLNDTPILPGLGRAVVSLPAGYDPTDPTGARRRAREQASQVTRWGPGADRRPGAPGPGRVDAGAPAPASDDRRPKKGPAARRGERSEHVPAPDSRSRKPKGRGGKDMRSVRPVQTVKHRVRIEGEITVANLAHEMGVKSAELIKLLLSMGQPATVNQTIDFDTASLLAQELGHEVVNIAFDEAEHLYDVETEGSDLPTRAPVVTIMGHVDHGKTTLLDTIRKAKVAAGEAGGITQHIGAYTVKRGDSPITFIDTPGHAAFSAMRARGAKATDIIVLVVAADDGVMPQTIEAISHAKAAGVPILVAVNKMDKPGVQPERVTRQLMEHGLVSEEYGGDVIFVPVSALKGTGVNDLLDNILVVAEVADLRANPDRHAEGVVLESRLEVGRGAVASLLVQTGTLKQGDTIVIGSTWGRVRAMSDDRGQKLKEAGPSTPVEIFGLQDVPNAGDEFAVVESEKDARALVDHRSAIKMAGAHSQRAKMTLEDLYKSGGEAVEVMKIILKADVSGSLEALRGALEGLVVSGTQLKILHAAIGPVNESDVNLAAPDQALIVAFDVKSDTKARQAADQYGVEIKKFEIIYNVIDEVKARMQGLLAPIYEEQKVGEAEVRALFKIPKLGFIAGCMVMDGKVNRGAAAKVFRAGKQIAEGKVTSLKRFKEDVREVEKGFECGIGVEGATDIQEGDKISLYTRVQVARPE